MADAITRLCASLRRNNGRFTRLETFNSHRGYGRVLGEALLHNTTVTFLCLDLRNILDWSTDVTINDAAPLLRYLQTSQTLKAVTVISFGDGFVLEKNLEELILQAVASNPSITVVDLSLDSTLSSPSFAHLLTTSTSITKLAIDDRRFVADASSLRQVASAFGANRSLQDVRISLGSRRCPQGGETEQIIEQLGYHPTLKTLSLSGSYINHKSHYQAIALLLMSTQTLESLELCRYYFPHKPLEHILEALKTNSTVTELCIKECSLSAEATDDFISFVQQCDRNNNNYRGVLRQVSVWPRDADSTFDKRDTAHVLATMLFDSSIKCLSFDEDPRNRSHHFAQASMVYFFRMLTKNQSRIQLDDLRLEYLSASDATALEGFLLQSTRLRNLVVACAHRKVRASSLLQALRQNGTIHWVSLQKQGATHMGALSHFDRSIEAHSFRSQDFMNRKRTKAFWAPWELKLTNAYCMRNKMIPLCLQQPMKAGSVTLDTRFSGGALIETTDLTLVPSLLVAAREAERMAPTFVFMGLAVTLGGTIGHSSDTKRRATELR